MEETTFLLHILPVIIIAAVQVYMGSIGITSFLKSWRNYCTVVDADK